MRSKVVVTVANMKGGVGKTTLSILLVHYLARLDKRVLLIDADPQGTASIHAGDKLLNDMGIPSKGLPFILEKFLREDGISQDVVERNIHVVSHTPDETFYLIPNFISSLKYDLELQSKGYHAILFKKILKELPFDVDVTVIDASPYFNSFVFSSLAIADTLVVPVETSPQALPGVELMLDTVANYTRNEFFSLKSILLVPTKVRRTRTSRYALSILRKAYEDYVSENYLPFTEIANKIFAGTFSLKHLETPKDNLLYKKVLEVLNEINKKCIEPFM